MPQGVEFLSVLVKDEASQLHMRQPCTHLLVLSPSFSQGPLPKFVKINELCGTINLVNRPGSWFPQSLNEQAFKSRCF